MKGKVENFDYSVVRGECLDAALAVELSKLFSSAYGKWSRKSPIRPGSPIRLSADAYLSNYAKRGFRIALCRVGRQLVAEAIYLETSTSRGTMAFVVQLVVAEKFRRRGIATALLHAVWGFSDYYGWGIVTSSPCTVEALEAATFRRCRAETIAMHRDFIRRHVLAKVPFLKAADWMADKGISVADTHFFTDRTAKPVARRRVEGRLGRLPEGHEWIALTFRDQDLDAADAYSQIVSCSGRFVAEAYANMPQSKQKWASKTREEIDFLLRWLPTISRDLPICDFGAGSGRHATELKRRGFKNVDAIDFAPTAEGVAAGVVAADCRSWHSSRRYGLILCLYDVIGSFADERSNSAILRNIARHLTPGGFVVLSVANFKYGGSRRLAVVNASNRSHFLKAVFRLAPSDTMATSGEFFDHVNALADPVTGLVYHKEQFRGGSALPGEYLVVDRRYTAGEIEKSISKAGLTIVRREFVRAGFAPQGERDGKEILVIAKKCVCPKEFKDVT